MDAYTPVPISLEGNQKVADRVHSELLARLSRALGPIGTGRVWKLHFQVEKTAKPETVGVQVVESTKKGVIVSLQLGENGSCIHASLVPDSEVENLAKGLRFNLGELDRLEGPVMKFRPRFATPPKPVAEPLVLDSAPPILPGAPSASRGASIHRHRGPRSESVTQRCFRRLPEWTASTDGVILTRKLYQLLKDEGSTPGNASQMIRGWRNDGVLEVVDDKSYRFTGKLPTIDFPPDHPGPVFEPEEIAALMERRESPSDDETLKDEQIVALTTENGRLRDLLKKAAEYFNQQKQDAADNHDAILAELGSES